MMHIVFLNPQGNFDKNDSYWTMHSDFGGQLVYVKEIASAMALKGHKIDILTRQFDDVKFPEFKDTFDEYLGIKNLRIIRIPCGSNKFLKKELLWGHLNEWTDNIIDFYKSEGSMFDFSTGHYGDGGLAAALIKEKTNIPYSFTGHSLGAQKLDKLGCNVNNFTSIDKKYNFTKRIYAERISIANSDIIFVSTNQEKNEQYFDKLYNNISLLINPLRFIVAPPGANTSVFDPNVGNESELITKKRIESTIIRDISTERLSLPFIISASRLDPKKNHIGLVKAYAKDPILQKEANLTISLRGINNAFDSFEEASKDDVVILNEIMEIVTKYKLIGKVMFISINSQSELATFYRVLAKKGSVFTLTALYEPFGLAPIEAMSAGLPVAVTKYGGPSEVLFEDGQEYGVLIDAFDEVDIAKGITKALRNHSHYKSLGLLRVQSKYTWTSTADKYLDAIKNKLHKSSQDSMIEIHKYFITPSKVNEIDPKILRKLFFNN